MFSVRRKLQRLLECLKLAEPRLMGFGAVTMIWTDKTGPDIKETITFYFLEYPSGYRFFRVFAYGHARELNSMERWKGEALTWTHGGPLPAWATPAGAPRGKAELRLVKG